MFCIHVYMSDLPNGLRRICTYIPAASFGSSTRRAACWSRPSVGFHSQSMLKKVTAQERIARYTFGEKSRWSSSSWTQQLRES